MTVEENNDDPDKNKFLVTNQDYIPQDKQYSNLLINKDGSPTYGVNPTGYPTGPAYRPDNFLPLYSSDGYARQNVLGMSVNSNGHLLLADAHKNSVEKILPSYLSPKFEIPSVIAG